MTQRNPYDGKPYYCQACGLGWSELLACEDECELESDDAARARQQDYRLAEFLGLLELNGLKWREAIRRLKPARRAACVRLMQVTEELNRWARGEGPLPPGVLVDGPRRKQ